MKRILFVTYGGGHAHMIYPVVHALRASRAFQDGLLAMDVLALPAATYTIRSQDIDCLGFGDFLDPVTDADALAWGRELAETHHSPTIGVTLEDSVAYLGLNFKDLVVRLGETQARAELAEKGRHAFLPLTIMERVFDRVRPDFVVTSNSPRSEAAAIATANARGIDNLIMTDLFTGLGAYVMQGRNITFLNEVAVAMMVNFGIANPKVSRFHLTGNPAFDKLLGLPREKSPAWLTAQFPQLAGRQIVLHADMPAFWDSANQCSHFKTDAETEEELLACWQAASACGAAYLIRPHPSQNRAFYERWLDGRPNAWLAAACNLHELLAQIDLLVCRTTTVGLEAALMGKRILQLDWRKHADLPIAAMGMAWGSEGYDRLGREMASALTDDVAFQAIVQQTGKMMPSEPAAPKVARIVLESMRLPL